MTTDNLRGESNRGREYTDHVARVLPPWSCPLCDQQFADVDPEARLVRLQAHLGPCVMNEAAQVADRLADLALERRIEPWRQKLAQALSDLEILQRAQKTT